VDLQVGGGGGGGGVGVGGADSVVLLFTSRWDHFSRRCFLGTSVILLRFPTVIRLTKHVMYTA